MDTKNLDSMMARMQAMQAAMATGLPGAPTNNDPKAGNGVKSLFLCKKPTSLCKA